MMDQNLKKRMQDKWSSTVKSEEYLKNLREENAVLDENTSKVKQNQEAKSQASDESANRSEKIIKERKAELQEDLKRMIDETKERASDTGNNLYGDYNTAEA
jgi:hypothetical protein